MVNVSDVMTKNITKVTPDATFRDMWKLIFHKKINAILVVDKRNKMLGIVTRDDMLQKLYPDYSEYVQDLISGETDGSLKALKDIMKMTAKQVMHKTVIFTRPQTPIMRALARMMARSVNQLPVADDRMKLLGIVTKGDIFYSLYRNHRSIFRKGE